MEISKQKQEAISRMQQLRIMPKVIDSFRRNNCVFFSERQSQMFNAVLYRLDNNEEWEKAVKDFEKEYGVIAYHCQLTHFEFGDVLSVLYVSNNEEDWPREREDLKDGYIMVKCFEVSYDNAYDSDMGYIQVRPSLGGITRIG